jgi:DNA-binding LacI/PurR family transcriptional regulator
VASVDTQLAKRVWKAIEELGYDPNRQARAVVSGRSHVFGLIVSEITNPFSRKSSRRLKRWPLNNVMKSCSPLRNWI